ncbi:hypothetical protein EQZ20_24545 (plasmid) [Bacillus glycinifermentans]|uniref:Uncharacterized protein n=1 Tax=Bacillus glycinifermentans TaxID=1664069 RepID=A0AAJ3Z3N9_9BACI|nr:hypothetical protein [Bacillus glycinifermentans]QAT68046.1 hypothetical protein EQZ20_24545 [Bacillus glycinifermentans]
MIRKQISFSEPEKSPYGIAYLQKEMNARGAKMNETIEQIFAEHDAMRRQIADQDALVEKIFHRFKNTLDVIRVRTGYADKNAQINLELWNAFFMGNPLGATVLTNSYVAEPVRLAQEKVTNDIAQFKQRRDEQRNKQAAPSGDN